MIGWLLNAQRTHGNRFVQGMLGEPRPRTRCACGGSCPDCQARGRERKRAGARQGYRRSLRQLLNRNLDGQTISPIASRPRFGADFSSVLARVDAQPGAPRSGRAKKILGVDVTKSDCGCIGRMDEEIDWSRSQVKRYSDCAKDPTNKTGKNIEDCVKAQHVKEGISTSVAGETSSTGVVTVKKQKGPCAAILEKGTAIHEGVHANHQQELEKMFGKGTPAFHAKWDDAQDWAKDEINSYSAEIPFYRAVKNYLTSVCGPINTTGAIVGGVLGGIGGAVLGAAVGGVGGAIGLGVLGAGVGALAGGLIGNLFED